MAVLDKRLTKDNFEMQMGINHLGHFYLTYLLWDLLKVNPNPRIINVSSSAHKRQGKDYKISFDDMFFDKQQYNAMKAYSSSKIANIMFTKELQRRMDQANIQGISASLHPGVVRT